MEQSFCFCSQEPERSGEAWRSRHPAADWSQLRSISPGTRSWRSASAVILFSGAGRGGVQTAELLEELISAECCSDSYAGWRVKEQRKGKIRPGTNCVALNPEGNHSNGSGLINLSNLGRDGVGSFMAAALPRAALIIFQRRPLLLYMAPTV